MIDDTPTIDNSSATRSSPPSSKKDEKFFFNMNVFDAEEASDEDHSASEAEPIEPAEPEIPPLPVFTQEDIEAAKKSAHAEGYAAGKAEVEQSRSQALAALMQRLGDSVISLTLAEHDREQRFEQECIALCLNIFSQILPHYHEQHGFDELTAHIRECLKQANMEHGIEIRVSNDYADGVETFIQKLREQNPKATLTVISDTSLTDDSFQINWQNGGASYDFVTLTQQIKEKLTNRIDDGLASLATNSHDSDKDESNTSLASDPSEDCASVEPLDKPLNDQSIATDAPETGETK